MPPVFLCHAVSAVRLSIRDLENLLVKKPIKYLQIAILCIIFASDFQEKHTNQNRELCLSTKS